MSQERKSQILQVGFGGRWYTLHPGLQHTLFGDLILGNKFEPLVGQNESGVPVPLGAKTWTVSDDFTEYVFEIDTDKKFLDGSTLEANDYKRSWEESIKLTPISANNSLLDVLYKIKGFELMESSGHVSGIEVISPSRLKIRFKSPFRTAIEHLQGSRFAAFKRTGDQFLGTGLFDIKEVNEDIVELIKFDGLANNTQKIAVKAFAFDRPVTDRIESGELDVIHYIMGHRLYKEDLIRIESGKVRALVGPDALNIVLGINCTGESIFNDVRLRRALQYLVHQNQKRLTESSIDQSFFDFDWQLFVPLQSGRISDEEINELVREGEKDVQKLKEMATKKPLLVHTGESTAFLLNFLKEIGISISKDSRVLSPKELVTAVYAQSGPDIIIDSFSVASGDPDGLYHALGINGAIKTPYVYDEEVSDLLENGRKLTDVQKLDSHYQLVSKKIFQNVPMIHIGFAKALTLYAPDRVEVDLKVLRRHLGQLHFLKLK